MNRNSTDRKILLLTPSGRRELGELIAKSGGTEVTAGSATKVMTRFLESAAGALAPFMVWTLWEFPLEMEGSGLKGLSMDGFEPPPGITMQEIAQFVTMGMVIVLRSQVSLPRLTELDRAILSEIARLGGSASMGILAGRLKRSAQALRKKLKYLELRGLISRSGTKSAVRYALSGPVPTE